MDYLAAFLLGLLSAPHCFAMCGGIASALLLTGRRQEVSETAATGNTHAVIASSSQLRVCLTVHDSIMNRALYFGSGKILGYMLLGAAAGLAGLSLTAFGPVMMTTLRVLAGLLLVALGLYSAGWWLGISRLEAFAYRLWQPALAKLRHLNLGTSGSRLVTGLLWGLLPCGIVYSVLGLALASASVVSGALIMLSFGLGTLPFVLGVGGVIHWLAPLLRNRRWRTVSGMLLIGFGAFTIATALNLLPQH